LFDQEKKMRRRQFLGLIAGGVAAGPLAAFSQPLANSPGIPVIGFLNRASPGGAFEVYLAKFNEGLGASGYVAGKNVVLEYRWADSDENRLRQHAADLVGRKVTLIVATGGAASAHAARSVTQTTPILFVIGTDPVGERLVSSINRPGGNATGMTLVSGDLIQKRMELLQHLVGTRKIAILIDPRTPSAESEKQLAQSMAEKTREAKRPLDVMLLEASADSQLKPAFESAVQSGAGALLVTPSAFFTSRSAQIVELARSFKLPTGYPFSDYVVAGGLMSYGANVADAYRLIGDYAGKILKGGKPEHLPVQTPTTFDLTINLKTANALDIKVPLELLLAATKVIEDDQPARR
jgi:putative ABC transport system substrate-binding protein